MTTKKIYGPWVKWHGGECPVPPDTIVKLKLRSGFIGEAGFAVNCTWEHHNYHADILEYCVAIEQADLDAAEKLLLANGYAVTPPAKPLTFEDVMPMAGLDTLLVAALARDNLQRAWKRVKANKGAAGVDGLDIEQIRLWLTTHWPEVRLFASKEARDQYQDAPVAHKERTMTTPRPHDEQLIEAFVDATAHLVAAASAYERHASRAKHLKPRAVADALFTTRLNDFKQAAARALAVCQKLKETK